MRVELYEKSTLANGLRVITAAMPHTRSAAVQYYIGAGARHEDPAVSGVSHFVEHMVFKGTAKRPSPLMISEAVEGVGGALDASTDHEHTNYRALVPSAHNATALDVLTDMILSALILPTEIKKEREVIVEEINSSFDSPGEIADLLFNELMWGHHPLGQDIAGTRQTVRRLKRQDIVDHIHSRYRPASIVLSVAGNVTHDAVVREVERLWQAAPDWARGGVEQANEPPPVEAGPKLRYYHKDTEQTNLIVGVPAFPYTHPLRYAQDVLDTILGGGMSSRLFVSIREDRGLAYSVSSFLRTYADVGALGVHAAVDNDRLVPTLEAVMSELKRIRDTPVPETELRKVKEYIKGHTLLGLERSGYVAHWAGWQELMLGKIEPVDDAIEQIEAVSADQVMEVAQYLFSTDKLHLSVVGPGRASTSIRKTLSLD